MNIERGVQKSLLLGMAGFLIPVVILGTIKACVFAFGDIHPMDLQQDLQRLPFMILPPALGCGIVFAIAAFASYVPKSGVNFIQSLLIIGSVVVVAILAVRYKMPGPSAWSETVVAIVAGIIASAVIIGVGVWKRGSDHPDVPKIIDK